MRVYVSHVVAFFIGFGFGIYTNLAAAAVERSLVGFAHWLVRWFASRLPEDITTIQEAWDLELRNRNGHLSRIRYALSRRRATRNMWKEYKLRQATSIFQMGIGYLNHVPHLDPANARAASAYEQTAGDLFRHALEVLGFKTPQDTLWALLRWWVRFAWIAISFRWRLYHRPLPRLRSLREEELPRYQLTLNALLYWGRAQVIRSPTFLFWQVVTGLRLLRRVGPGRISGASTMYAECAGIFAYTGKRFALSNEILKFAESLLPGNDPTEKFLFDVMHFVIGYLHGDWSAEDLVTDDTLRWALGQTNLRWHVNLYLGLKCDLEVRQGKFNQCEQHLELLNELGTNYLPSEVNAQVTRAVLLIEQRNLNEALRLIIQYSSRIDDDNRTVLACGLKAKIQAMQNDVDGARASLNHITRMQLLRTSAWHQGPYWFSRLLVEVVETGHLRSNQNRAGQMASGYSARRLLRKVNLAATRAAPYRIEIHKLKGILWWLLDDQRHALNIWDHAKDMANEMDAKPELARVRHEIGSRLSRPGVDYAQTGARNGADDLRAANELFERLGIEPDPVIGP